jgi:hypothetical protein
MAGKASYVKGKISKNPVTAAGSMSAEQGHLDIFLKTVSARGVEGRGLSFSDSTIFPPCSSCTVFPVSLSRDLKRDVID